MSVRAPVSVGEIYSADRFYSENSEWKRKYLLVLAIDRSGDLVFRLLTSRRNNRPIDPACFHGDPYPGFYVGVLGAPLTQESWVDLRSTEDYDGYAFQQRRSEACIELVTSLDNATMCSILDCVASALDTTTRQEQLLRDQRALLGCS